MEIIKLFPTLVGRHNNIKFANEVLPIANKLLEGREKNHLGYVNTYSDSEVHDHLSSIDFITEYINFISYGYISSIGFSINVETELSLFVSNMTEGDHMPSHIHPRSILSGICYLECEPVSAPIVFEDYRDIRLFNGLVSMGEYNLDLYNEYNNREIEFYPKNGDILIWESWMRHYVKPNASTTRKTIVWNLSYK